MAKKEEFKIGEVFQCGLVKIKCVKTNSLCAKCYFIRQCNHEITGHCFAECREDKTDVIFVRVEE